MNRALVLLMLTIMAVSIHLTVHEQDKVYKKCCKYVRGLQLCSSWADNLDDECGLPTATMYCLDYIEVVVMGFDDVECHEWSDELPSEEESTEEE